MLSLYYKSEQKKFIYQRWNIIVMLGIAVLVPVMAVTLGSFAGESGALLCKSKLIQGFYLGQAGYTVLAALYFGAEYQRLALRTSLLGAPNRGMLLLAKLLCVSTWTLILLFVSTIASVTALKLTSAESLPVGELITALLPAYISTLELVVITGCIVVLTRSAIASMAVMVSLILGLGNILLQYSPAMRFLPVLSTMNGFLVANVPQYLQINIGMAVQGVWGILLLISAFFVFKKRYVR